MHKCKGVYKRLETLLKEIEEVWEPGCTELDWNYLKLIKMQLQNCFMRADMWIESFNGHTWSDKKYHGEVVNKKSPKGKFIGVHAERLKRWKKYGKRPTRGNPLKMDKYAKL